MHPLKIDFSAASRDQDHLEGPYHYGPWITVFGLSVQGYICWVTEACALGAVNVMTLGCQDNSNQVYIRIQMWCTVSSIGPDGSIG